MKVELTADAAQWVEAEIAAGTFLTPEEAVHHAVSEARASVTDRSRHLRANARIVADIAAPKRTPQEAATRMLNRRRFHELPEGTTLRDLMTFGRA